MLDQQYNSEIEILLAQFLSAFDDCVIRRGKDEMEKKNILFHVILSEIKHGFLPTL